MANADPNISYFSNESWPSQNETYEVWDDEQTDVRFFYYLWTFVAPSIFICITVVGVAGNSLVIYVIASRKAMQTVTNFLLLNLAIADSALLLICSPFTAYKYYASTWPLGDVSCKLVQYLMYVSVYVTVYTLVAISALRLLTVVWTTSTANYRNKSNIVTFILFLWVVMFGLHVPTLLAHRRKTHEGYSYCGTEERALGPIILTFFVFAYALPLMLISVMYLLIVCHLKKSCSAMVTQARTRTARTLRVIILVVVMFGLAWLPFHINSLLFISGIRPIGASFEVFRILCNCLAYGNSCVNPFIYNCMATDFRKNFKEVACCAKRRNSTASESNARTQLETIPMI